MRDPTVAPLLDVRDLVKTFPAPGGGRTRAVDGVSLSVPRGETYGLVGESGSGKSTLGRCVLRLTEPDAGTVLFDGRDVGALPPRSLRRLRARVQVVFQDPHGSLNRRQTVRDIVAAPLRAHGVGIAREREARVAELLDLVRLPAGVGGRRPRELSGGQAQRVAIARALALRPDFVVLDEAVSALDVSVRAQILNLLSGLQRELGLTYLFISHDLGIVRYMARRVGVMYRGRIVEEAPREVFFSAPRHPYTRLLLDAVPAADPARRRARTSGAAPVTEAVAAGGCRFLPRCPVGAGRDLCAAQDPPLLGAGSPPAFVACHYPGVNG
ncbi:ABC di/oligopeptide transporter ATPase [Sphaerisporangium siamense]|uniref:Oligopeptide/dipeptide ABC transporter ATP-binding protein n=1 Tax=Sphaerisporangium siamense TaxID=795645 RepID=A0A7W7D733_9ACTN|nr:oligopeptide/dipeptide ABC transporter ATP-binding protein [Sphaerisporangium siamense]MBB4700580.1 oligopeptide/dipeptide ABC transporter ATP-binding protein [Sphaerisporangium siamense]GII88890.1 ABC di/oligopeptide transporter ATPase [Sphaerisporangium siamense]